MPVGVNQGFHFREGSRDIGDLIVTAINPTLGRISLEFENAVTFREISLGRGESCLLGDGKITVKAREIIMGRKEPLVNLDFYTKPWFYQWEKWDYE